MDREERLTTQRHDFIDKLREREREMYNPFSIYTVIPWAIVFNVSEAIIMIILDAAIGTPFNDLVKGVLCIILYVLNMAYIIYTMVIHFRVVTMNRKAQQIEYERRNRLYPITFTDLFNLLIASGLIWVWLFMALYFFDHAMYTNVLTGDNQPRTFFKVYFKFYAYTVVALNAGTTTIFPLLTISEVAEAFGVLYNQIVTVLVLAGFLTYLMDVLKEASSAPDITSPPLCSGKKNMNKLI